MDDNVPAPAARSRVATVFVGQDGLRAGWSLVLFLALVFLASFGMLYALRLLHPYMLHEGAGVTPTGTIVQEALSLLIVRFSGFAKMRSTLEGI